MRGRLASSVRRHEQRDRLPSVPAIDPEVAVQREYGAIRDEFAHAGPDKRRPATWRRWRSVASRASTDSASCVKWNSMRISRRRIMLISTPLELPGRVRSRETCLGDHRLACVERRPKHGDPFFGPAVVSVTPIQQRHPAGRCRARPPGSSAESFHVLGVMRQMARTLDAADQIAGRLEKRFRPLAPLTVGARSRFQAPFHGRADDWQPCCSVSAWLPAPTGRAAIRYSQSNCFHRCSLCCQWVS